jgi:hypothetical protein
MNSSARSGAICKILLEDPSTNTLSTSSLLPLSQVGLAQMLKGGVIMDVVTPEEARIAEEAGAVAVMALERVPADIRRQGGVARMSDPQVSLLAPLFLQFFFKSSHSIGKQDVWSPQNLPRALHHHPLHHR